MRNLDTIKPKPFAWCHSHTKIEDYFGSYLLALKKKVLAKNLKFDLFPTYVQVTLIKSKLQIHLANPTNPETLKFITKFLQIKGFKKFKICPSLTRSFKYKKRPKLLDIIEFIM